MNPRENGMSRPAIITRRALLTGATAAAALAGLPRDAYAAANEFSYAAAIADGFLTPLIGGTTQQVERWAWWVGHALDASANRYWAWNPYTQAWIGSGSGSQDPGAGTNGLDVSGVSGSKYPMWAGYQQSASEAVKLVSATADLQRSLPSGFSSLATMAGGPVTWNPSDKNANVSLTDSDATAYHAAGGTGWPSVRATAAITGKAYWETRHRSSASVQHMIGLGNASASLSQYPGQNSNSFAWYLANGAFFGASGGTPGAWPGALQRVISTTVPRTTGKHFFEGRFVTRSGAAFIDSSHVSLGLAPSGLTLTTDMGRSTGGYSVFANSGHYSNGSSVGSGGGFATGDYVLSVYDFGASKNWNYINGAWDSGSPLTPTGGWDISAITGVPLYPAVSMLQTDGMTATVNFSSGFNYSSIVSSLEAIGYTAWDTPNGGSGPRGRIILGQNSPVRRALCGLLAA